MTINLSLTESQVHLCMAESAEFRCLIVNRLMELQNALDKLKGDYPSEAMLLMNLQHYIKTNFGPTTKIQAIKYVRQWAVDNKATISPTTYNDLYSLAGAKGWVEKYILYPNL